MSLEFAAMLIIMVLLIAVAVLILKSLTASAGVRIRSDMVHLLASYDDIIDGKSAEIRRLKREKQRMEERAPSKSEAAAPSPEPRPVSEMPAVTGGVLPSSASYRTGSFGEGYGAVRRAFRMDDGARRRLVRDAAEREGSSSGRGQAAKALLGQLDFDTVFALSRMQPDEQLQLLDTGLRDRDWALLRDFCEERGEDTPFDVTVFWSWLKDLAALENSEISVRCGEKSMPDADYSEGICEGVQIRAGSHLYDYSIQEREIS